MKSELLTTTETSRNSVASFASALVLASLVFGTSGCGQKTEPPALQALFKDPALLKLHAGQTFALAGDFKFVGVQAGINTTSSNLSPDLLIFNVVNQQGQVRVLVPADFSILPDIDGFHLRKIAQPGVGIALEALRSPAELERAGKVTGTLLEGDGISLLAEHVRLGVER